MNMIKSIDINKLIIPVLFLMLPFVVLTSGVIWKSQQLFILISVTIIIAFSLKNVWVKLFLLYGAGWSIFLFVRQLLSGFVPVQPPPQSGLSVLLFLMAGGILFKFVSESKLSNNGFYNIIRIAVILQVIVVICQFFGLNPLDALLSNFIEVKTSTGNVGLKGTLGNRDILACFFAVSFPVFLVWKTGKLPADILITIPVLMISFMIFFAPSPGALAFIVGYTIFKSKSWKGYAIGLSVAIVYFALFIAPSYTVDFLSFPGQVKDLATNGLLAPAQSEGRLWKWLTAFGIIIQSPGNFIFGSGPGASWGRHYPLHNEYMQCWFEFGIIGLTMMLGYIFTTLRYLIKSKNIVLLASFGAACIDMGANYSLHIATTAFMIIIVAGLIERERNYGKVQTVA